MNKFVIEKGFMGGRLHKGPSQRQLRVAEEIRHILADVFIRTEFRDPVLQGQKFTVTEVRMTPDLRNAIVYVSHLGQSDTVEFLPAFKKITSYLKTQLARKLRLKFLPDLRFQADTALDYASRIEAVLHSPEVLRDIEKKETD